MTSHIGSFASNCMGLIEKAQSQATANNLITSEALSASLLLAIFLASDISSGMTSYFGGRLFLYKIQKLIFFSYKKLRVENSQFFECDHGSEEANVYEREVPLQFE